MTRQLSDFTMEQSNLINTDNDAVEKLADPLLNTGLIFVTFDKYTATFTYHNLNFT